MTVDAKFTWDREESHKILRGGPEGIEKWNAARKANPDAVMPNLHKLDFSRADMRGADLSKLHFDANDFTEAKLQGADFRRATLSSVCFERAKLHRAQFDGAELRSNSTLKDAEFYATKGLFGPGRATINGWNHEWQATQVRSAQFRHEMDFLGWTQSDWANALGCSTSAVKKRNNAS